MEIAKMTDIDLGFAEQCKSEWLTNAYFPSKLGGRPAWLHLGALPTSKSLECGSCRNQKSFLCQIYAPFEDQHNFHRTIYVFVCRTKTCCIANKNDNVTVLRSQLPLNNEFYASVPPPEEGEPVPEILPKKLKLCAACGCLGPYNCGRCKKTNYCGIQHQRLHWPYHKLTCSPKETIPDKTKDQQLSHILFPEWEIDTISPEDDFIRSESKSDGNSEKEELRKLENLRISGKAGTLQNLPDSELEKYAQGRENVDDKYFQKFRKECEKNPSQIIRYKRNGEVLWISDPEITVKDQLKNIPKCELCSEERVFEFQIMPQMLNYLNDSNLDWGVIAIYTCPRSCPLPQEKGYVEEFCIKQDIVNN